MRLFSTQNHTATGTEYAVIEGKNTVNVINSILKGAKDWGVMIYQSMSGDAEIGLAHFMITDGLLEAAGGPLFHVTYAIEGAKMSEVKASAASGALIHARAYNWGTTGSNGGKLTFIAYKQTLNGNILVDNISTVAVTVQNGSSLKGAINPDNTSKEVKLTLDKSCTWDVTADAYLTSLSDKDGIIGETINNIIGNGHTVCYNKSTSAELGSNTYSLKEGGNLKPAN